LCIDKFVFKTMVSFKLLNKIDIFGINMELMVGKNKVHKTFLGAIMTLIVTSTVSFYFMYMIQDLYLKNNPIVLQKVKFDFKFVDEKNFLSINKFFNWSK